MGLLHIWSPNWLCKPLDKVKEGRKLIWKLCLEAVSPGNGMWIDNEGLCTISYSAQSHEVDLQSFGRRL